MQKWLLFFVLFSIFGLEIPNTNAQFSDFRRNKINKIHTNDSTTYNLFTSIKRNQELSINYHFLGMQDSSRLFREKAFNLIDNSLNQAELLEIYLHFIELPHLDIDTFVVEALHHFQAPKARAQIYLAYAFHQQAFEKLDYCTSIMDSVQIYLAQFDDQQISAQYHFQKSICYLMSEAINKLNHLLKAEELVDRKSPLAIEVITSIGVLYDEIQAFDKTVEQGYKGLKLARENNSLKSEMNPIYNIISGAYPLKRYDLVKEHCLRAIEINPKIDYQFNLAYIYGLLGRSNLELGKLEEAIEYFNLCLDQAQKGKKRDFSIAYEGLARVYFQTQNHNKANYYAQKAKNIGIEHCENCDQLAKIFINMGDYPTAYQYLNIINERNIKIDSTFNTYNIASSLLNENFKKEKTTLELAFQQEKLQGELELRNRNFLLLIMLGAICIGLIFTYAQYNGNKVKKNLLDKIGQQNTALNQANQELLRTQNQLIIQEKMASLGQLTAGIAHELKNPLNFVINFSEGSLEMLEELKEELEKETKNISQNSYKEIMEVIEELDQNANDISDNGKRATSIIQNMMNHARGTQEKRQNTNYNQLILDTSKLAYHGFQTKNKDFSVQINTDLDPNINNLLVFPQEFSRVLINLLNNAFFAMQEKNKLTIGNYIPTMYIKTNRQQDFIETRIRDNATGIPANIIEKIFDPFFTTKPTGTGNTGLGLSIVYDIITKRHHGKIKVISEAGEFTEFIIQLPISSKII